MTHFYVVVCCSGCGFIFADIVDTQRSYNKYHSEYNVYSSVSKLKETSYEKPSIIKLEISKFFL